MLLRLVTEVPSSASEDETLVALHHAAASGEGATITTSTGFKVDVMLHDIERITLSPSGEGTIV